MFRSSLLLPKMSLKSWLFALLFRTTTAGQVLPTAISCATFNDADRPSLLDFVDFDLIGLPSMRKQIDATIADAAQVPFHHNLVTGRKFGSVDGSILQRDCGVWATEKIAEPLQGFCTYDGGINSGGAFISKCVSQALAKRLRRHSIRIRHRPASSNTRL